MEEQRQKELEGLCRQLGMEMKDLHLLDMALTHTSYAYESKKIPGPSTISGWSSWGIRC